MDMIDKLVDQAMKKIKGQLLAISEDIAYEISETIQENYESCIDAFYDSYSPWFYDRTYSTYMASSGGKDLLTLHNKVVDCGDVIEITAGIDVDSSRLGQPYKDPADYVFNRTWQWGIHGTMFTGGWIMPSPKMEMDKWFKGFKQSEYRRIINKYLGGIGLKSVRRKG